MFARISKTKKALLVAMCSITFSSGACLPENYIANLFQSITTNGANLIIQSVIVTVIEGIGLQNPLTGTVVVETAPADGNMMGGNQ